MNQISHAHLGGEVDLSIEMRNNSLLNWINPSNFVLDLFLGIRIDINSCSAAQILITLVSVWV